MKKIEAIIGPEKLNLVKNTLKAIGISGMTVTEARGFGSQGGHKEIFRGVEYSVNYIPKAKVELVVEEREVDRIIDAIVDVCQDDEKMGGGKIFVSSIEEVIRIRTNEKGRAAI